MLSGRAVDRFGWCLIVAIAACNGSGLTTGGAANDLAVSGAVDAAVACRGLTESACAAQLACARSYCNSCGFDIRAFVGCRPATEPRPPCPTSCPAGISCGSDDDCVSPNSICVQPGQPTPYCGDQCKTDADCARGVAPRCLPPACQGTCCGNYCVPGCLTDGDCAFGEVCTSGLCTPPPCSSSSLSSSCPLNFLCSGTLCQRIACGSDAACGALQHCVRGACYSGLGTCAPP